VSTKPIYATIPDPVRQLCSAGDHLLGHPGGYRGAVWGWQISAVPQAQRLMFWGLALAAAGNAVAALGLIKSRKERKLSWEWTAVFIGLLFVQYACLRGYFHFNWLKQTLLWLQKHLP
jgi:hypothetical protein